MRPFGVLAALALMAAPGFAADDPQPDQAAYARLRGDAQNLLTQARSLAFDGLTGAPGLLGQIATVAGSLNGLKGNAEAAALAGELSSLQQKLQDKLKEPKGDTGAAEDKDKNKNNPSAQGREAVKAFRAEAGSLTSLAQRALTLANPGSAARPKDGPDKEVPHAVETSALASGGALPLATQHVGDSVGQYGAFADPKKFDQTFAAATSKPTEKPAWLDTANPQQDPQLKDALAKFAPQPQTLEKQKPTQERNDVLLQQKAINAIRKQQGLPAITEDGRFGAQTQAAVRRIQGKKGSGVIDQDTSDKIALLAAQAGPKDKGSFIPVSDSIKPRDLPRNARVYDVDEEGKAKGHGHLTFYGSENGGSLDSHDHKLCTIESYARGRCGAVTVAAPPADPPPGKKRSGTPIFDGQGVDSPALQDRYAKYCASLGAGCKNREWKATVSDRCPGCAPDVLPKYPNANLDLATAGPAREYFDDMYDVPFDIRPGQPRLAAETK